MTANRELAKRRDLSDEDISQIDEIHEQLESLITKRSPLGVFNQAVYDKIEDLEFRAQELWGFPQDKNFHTWKHVYEFKCQWVGRKFRCTKTGEEFTIPEDVYETAFYKIGEGYVDTGRLNFYSRFSGVQEIKEE